MSIGTEPPAIISIGFLPSEVDALLELLVKKSSGCHLSPVCFVKRLFLGHSASTEP